ncbi:hypothetical protein [Motiliproteus sp. SC1-56]|uniref:hypothetical protein n=1 Tax=Motiliproteus sp. SC1-56 TaxID=2799565 RepID=UPI001A8EEE0B|nr:hypothetical protein [Motiliproteus sp. SC1-56]
MIAPRLLAGFGWCSLGASVLALLAAPLGLQPAGRGLDAYLFILCLMAAVSGALVIAARLRRHNHPLAEKVVPSSLVAYLLFLLITFRWLTQ